MFQAISVSVDKAEVFIIKAARVPELDAPWEIRAAPERWLRLSLTNSKATCRLQRVSNDGLQRTKPEPRERRTLRFRDRGFRRGRRSVRSEPRCGGLSVLLRHSRISISPLLLDFGRPNGEEKSSLAYVNSRSRQSLCFSHRQRRWLSRGVIAATSSRLPMPALLNNCAGTIFCFLLAAKSVAIAIQTRPHVVLSAPGASLD